MSGKIQYILANKNINIKDSIYSEAVEFTAMIPIEDYDRICNEITEATSARAKLEEVERLYFFV
jgi:putative IMPACT (imprinted ancient) family translation regulator